MSLLFFLSCGFLLNTDCVVLFAARSRSPLHTGQGSPALLCPLARTQGGVPLLRAAWNFLKPYMGQLHSYAKGLRSEFEPRVTRPAWSQARHFPLWGETSHFQNYCKNSLKRMVLNQGPLCPTPCHQGQCLGTYLFVTVIAIFPTLYLTFGAAEKSFKWLTVGQSSGIHFQYFKIFRRKMCTTPNYTERQGTESVPLLFSYCQCYIYF